MCVVQACRLVRELVCLCLWDMLDPVFVFVCVCVCGCVHVWERGMRRVGLGAMSVMSWSAVGLSQMQRQLPLEAWQATSRFLSTVHLSTGVLLDVQKFFHISDSNAGLLQTGKEGVPSLGSLAHAGRGSFGRSCSLCSSSCWWGVGLSPIESPGAEDGWWLGGRDSLCQRRKQ